MQNTYLDVNSVTAKIMGLAKHEIVGKKVTDFYPDIETEWFIKYGEIVKTGKFETFELFDVSTGCWYNVLALPLGDQDRFAIMATDITKRKEMEVELRKSKERQAFQLKLSDMLRPLSDAKEIKRTAAQVVCEHLGVDRVLYNEITDNGSTIHIEDSYVPCGARKITGDFPVSSFGAAMDVLRRGEPLIVEGQTTTPLKQPPAREAGTSPGVYASMTVPLIKEGRWVANFGVLQSSPRKWTDYELAILKDAAQRTWKAVERAKTEQALRASEEKFRGFIETAGEGIVECDAEGRIVFVNQQTVDMLGYTQDELLGRFSWDYVAEDQVEQSRADRKRLNAGHNIAREYKLRHKDGSLVWTQCNTTPLYDARGQYQGSLTMHADISERKQMEEDKQRLLNAVRMERDSLSALVNNIPDEVWFVDSSGKITMTNQSVQEAFGASYLGINMVEVAASLEIYRADGSPRPLDECFTLRALKGEKVVNLVEIIRTPVDNELKYRQSNAAPVRDVNGTIIGAVSIARDITELKQAEQGYAMSRLDKISTSYVNNSDLPAILGDILELAIDFTGADMGNIQLLEAESGSLRIMAYRGFKQPFLDYFAVVEQETGCSGTALQRGERVIVEDVTRSPIFAGTPALEVMLQAGARAVQSTPLISRSGIIVGMLSTYLRSPHRPKEQDLQLVDLLAHQAADLIERMRAEEALRHSEERFSKIFNNNPDIIVIIDMATDRFVDINPKYTEVLGYTRAEVLGRTPLELGCITDEQQYEQRKQEIHQSGFLKNHETVLRSKAGQLINVLFAIEVVEIDGRQQRISIAKDVTKEKMMEAEMARLDRLSLIGEMAAGIGHEIRNPLTAVRGFLQLLGKKPQYAGDRAYFDLMIEEVDQANGIITEYLNMDSDKPVNLQPHLLDQVVRALLPVIMSEANLREMDVKLDLNSPPEAAVDVNEIRQLILNMSRNAMDAMSPRGTLTIGTRQEAGEVILYLKDEGTGLPPEIIDRLGTPFLTTKDHGTGLGLAVCYSIAARHNARIDYETGTEGTTFCLHFPVASEQRPPGME
ncbi:PAS domain S-box protein [Sporotomaculum syntrophicum]|nr:PAS domain S-box protein [Sporotomaculum syntrophicum]